jgi:hypothetical protein
VSDETTIICDANKNNITLDNNFTIEVTTDKYQVEIQTIKLA